MSEVAKELNVKNMSDWYKIHSSDVTNTLAKTLIRVEFKGSLYNAVIDAFPEHHWQAWLFNRVPLHWWSVKANQKQFVDEYLAPKLGIQRLEDWYRITEKQVIKAGAGRLLSIYDNCLSEVLSSIYSTHIWEEWKFDHLPRGFLMQSQNCRRFLDAMAEHLNVSKPEDWYRVTLRQLSNAAGRSTSLRVQNATNNFHDCMFHLLTRAYPEHNWLAWKFHRVPKGFWESPQRQREFLEHILKGIKNIF